MYKEEGPENASRGTFDADLLEYVTQAQTGLRPSLRPFAGLYDPSSTSQTRP